MKHDKEWLDHMCSSRVLSDLDMDPESFEGRNAVRALGSIATAYAEHVVSNKQVHDTLLSGLNVANGEAILSLEGGACGLLASIFAEQFKESGATNYLVLDLNNDDTGPMTITMQRKEGSTPAEKLRELTAENQLMKDALVMIATESDELTGDPRKWPSTIAHCALGSEFKDGQLIHDATQST